MWPSALHAFLMLFLEKLPLGVATPAGPLGIPLTCSSVWASEGLGRGGLADGN